MTDDRPPTERDGSPGKPSRASAGSGDVPNPETGLGLGATKDASTFEPEEDAGGGGRASDRDTSRDAEVLRTTQAERDRAMAVHALDDETRMHTAADETDIVQGGGGELHHLDDDGTPADD